MKCTVYSCHNNAICKMLIRYNGIKNLILLLCLPCKEKLVQKKLGVMKKRRVNEANKNTKNAKYL